MRETVWYRWVERFEVTRNLYRQKAIEMADTHEFYWDDAGLSGFVLKLRAINWIGQFVTLSVESTGEVIPITGYSNIFFSLASVITTMHKFEELPETAASGVTALVTPVFRGWKKGTPFRLGPVVPTPRAVPAKPPLLRVVEAPARGPEIEDTLLPPESAPRQIVFLKDEG